ncbi:hypothetical protein Droror1_Dr00017214 [Drosera rotundifolia]
MQTEGFEYLKESCPSVLSDLLQYVAATKHSVCSSRFGYGIAPDGSDVNRRQHHSTQTMVLTVYDNAMFTLCI